MDSVEVRTLRRQTDHFIAQDSTTIIPHRAGSRNPDGAGGYTQEDGGDRDPIVARKVIQGGNMASRNIDGEEITPAFVFICKWDADLATGDTFKLKGIEYRVIFVRDRNDNSYETWAEVAQRG